ncbi:MAG: preprotein translocase subunit SecG [Wigglesworthia glossinidia]|nr:preprotein translocase subunit SecG [Wigglesworthia glossinidia]
MHIFILIVFLIVSIGLVFLIIIQDSKSYDIHTTYNPFSSSIFGKSTSNNAITKFTAFLAALFFILSLILGRLNSNVSKNDNKWESLLRNVSKEEK